MESDEQIEAGTPDEPERPEPGPRSRANTRWLAARRWVLVGTVLVAVVVLVVAIWLPSRDSGGGGGGNAANSAANANTAASPQGSPVANNGLMVPPPSMCQVMPRSLSALAQLVGTPVASPSAAGTPASPIPPQGLPADPQTTQKAILTVEVAIACHNAGDYPRLFTLYSDNYARQLLTAAAAETQLPPGAVAVLLGTPRPLAATQQRGIQAMGGVDQLADGRVAVLVVTVDPTRPTATEPSLYVLISKNGLLQIDNIIDLGSQATPAP